jgi:citrate lyase beta subunit
MGDAAPARDAELLLEDPPKAEEPASCMRVGALSSSAHASRCLTLTECACQQFTLQKATALRALLQVDTLQV